MEKLFRQEHRYFLGQNFAKAFDVQFATKEGNLDYVWATSWGVSTRLMGALVMAHSDNNGLVIPPKLAPIQVVMVPLFKNDTDNNAIIDRIEQIKKSLEDSGISVKIDSRDNLRSGFKFSEWELKGVPVRVVIGSRDMENNTAEVARRDTMTKEILPAASLVEHIKTLLVQIQENIYDKALRFREANTFKVDNYIEFRERLEEGGFFLCHWDGTAETEEKIKEETKATIRCIPLDNNDDEPGFCIYSGKPSKRRVIFARAY